MKVEDFQKQIQIKISRKICRRDYDNIPGIFN